MDEARIDIIGSNGNTGDHYGWVKHDGTGKCPVHHDALVVIETYTPRIPSDKQYRAGSLAWHLVKFYKVVSNEQITEVI
jgi:hypothetical protein